MKARFSPAVFAIVFSVVYAAAFWFNKPLFQVYPLNGDFVWGPTPLADAGPGMAWYGLMADAGIAAVVFAFVVPDRVVERALRNRVWLFPVGAMLVSLYLLRIFFFR